MKAKVDYKYFGFSELFKGIRNARNIFIIFFGLGYLSKVLLQRKNRNIIKKLK